MKRQEDPRMGGTHVGVEGNCLFDNFGIADVVSFLHKVNSLV
nr:hypothetical protein [uncultured Duganella sp.]